jgi:hypothetical protein
MTGLAWVGAGGIVIAAAIAFAFLFFGGAAPPALLAGINEGVTLKTAAIIGVIASIVLLVVLAVVAGDGLVGEVQYLIAGFFLFFVFFTLFVAWVF